MDPYFSRPEVSNSILSEIEKYWLPQQQVYDIEQAYKFGTLIDAMITEPHRVNYYQLTCDEYQYTRQDFDRAERMKDAFRRDSFCQAVAAQAEFQKVTIVPEFEIDNGILNFKIPARCKWDLFSKARNAGISGDIKSTATESQAAFEAAVKYFRYHRQAAWYMDLEGIDRFMILGISKVNYKIFKVPIVRGSEIYNEGRDDYKDLAFKWHYLFNPNF